MFDVSVELDGLGTLRLTGEEPHGYPCETYLDGGLLERSQEGIWSWDTAVGLPSPISHIDQMRAEHSNNPDHLRYALGLDGRMWERYSTDDSMSEAFRARAALYAQYALTTPPVITIANPPDDEQTSRLATWFKRLIWPVVAGAIRWGTERYLDWQFLRRKPASA